MSRYDLWAWGACVVAAMVLGDSAPAEACGHIVEMAVDTGADKVARADRLLESGQPARAYQIARAARRTLEREQREEGPSRRAGHLITRSRWITALAVVRLGGNVPISRRAARRGVVRGRQGRSLQWALGHLQAIEAERPGDLRVRAAVAEAMARIPAHRAAARSTLMDLAQRDLLPTPQSYAALLRLLDADQDREAWDRALERCLSMAAGDASRICPRSSSPSS